MPTTRPGVNMIRLGPEVPLGRRGCLVESSKTHEVADDWADTFLAGAVARWGLGAVIQLLRNRGETVFTVIKRVAFGVARCKGDFKPELQGCLADLIKLGVVRDSATGHLELENPGENWGACLECAVLIVLQDLTIEAHRDVKVQYPYDGVAQHDPDGQKYDVLGGLDLSRLLWLECKKPLYLEQNGNPLGQVLSKESVQRFYRRAHFLKPNIAVFLVDTLSDYRPDLRVLFSDEFRNSGCYVEPPPPANQLMARLHGFIYFVRVQYSSPTLYFEALRQSISQVLHDSRHDWVQFGFSGDPFRRISAQR